MFCFVFFLTRYNTKTTRFAGNAWLPYYAKAGAGLRPPAFPRFQKFRPSFWTLVKTFWLSRYTGTQQHAKR